jgi:alpha-beta hydrolase superfamily lysophospholipase
MKGASEPRSLGQSAPALGLRLGRLLLSPAVYALDALARLVSRPFWREPLATERYRALTSDGWQLALRRLRRSARPAHGPVLLIHGVGGTGNAFLMRERSPAALLADAGFDCWVADLRGRPESVPPSSARARNWDLEDYLDRDLPALIDTVLHESGASQLGWVGHSMGGILGYAYMLRHAPRNVTCMVTLGAALDYTHGDSNFRDLLELRGLLDMLPFVPVGALAQLSAPLLGLLPAKVARFSYHPRNLERSLARHYFASTMCNISCAELRDLCSVVETGGLCDYKAERFYAREAHAFTMPLLAVAGDDDHQCDVRDVRATFEQLGSSDKTFLGVGSRFGHAAPYGHEDLLVGRNTLREVWPEVAAWLAPRVTPGR